jgi:hypothetical protein
MFSLSEFVPFDEKRKKLERGVGTAGQPPQSD